MTARKAATPVPETWVPVKTHTHYMVSDRGRVKNAVTGLILKQQVRARYLAVELYGPRKKFSVHVLVAEGFIGPRPEGMLVLHKDGQNFNNRAANLRYGSSADNVADSVRHGTRYTGRGAQIKGAKLTNEVVTEIVNMLDSGIPQPEIAEKYGITQPAVSLINTGKNWNWLTNRRNK